MSLNSKKSLQEIYPYHLVEFINVGRRPKVKKVYIVATKWLNYNESKKQCTVKYPPPPYDSETSQEFETMLENLSNVPDAWQVYNVRLKGKAKSLDEAMEKIKELNEKETALTLESDENSAQAEKKAADSIRKEQFKRLSSNFQASYANSASPFENNTGLSSQTQSTSTIHRFSNMIDRSNSMAMIRSGLSVESSRNDSYGLPYNKLGSFTTGAGTTDSANDLQEVLPIQNLIDLNDDVLKKLDRAEKVIDPSEPNTKSKPVEKYKTKQTFQPFMIDCWANIMKEISQIKDDIRKININVQYIISMQQKVNNIDKGFIGTVQQITEKYQYSIPFAQIENFEDFDVNLESNTALKNDVCTVLQTGFDVQLIISKCIVNMLKMFITKDVAVQYNAIKSTNNKKVMRTTNFFNCIEVIIKQRRTVSNLNTTDKEILTALSNVLSNAVS